MAEILSESNSRPIETEGGEALYRATLDKFQSRLADKRVKAMRQFGMTLFHSLPVAQRIKLGEALGVNPDNATTHYNLGVLAAVEQDWAKAIAEFQAALKMDASMRVALYNLALATDKNGDVAKARRLYNELVDSVNEEAAWAEDVAKIKARLSELEAA